MGRVSRQQADENHKQILEAASHLFRANGLKETSVPQVMAAAGLTHGGFYGHFASKEALSAAACENAFSWLEAYFNDIAARHPGDLAAARSELIGNYLSADHRDHPGDSCPAISLGADVAREPADSPVREAYRQGIEGVLEVMRDKFGASSHSQALANYSTLVGALLLARATEGSPLADEILDAARQALLPR